MDKSSAVPHVPSEPLPELDEFLKPFQALFRRRESQTAMERYLSGLLTEYPVKNCDTLADIVPGTTEQQLQGLLTQMIWDEAALNQRRVQILRTLKTEGEGVARQYSGTLGKVANCQITVNCHYAERTVAWPVTTRLYLSKAWCADGARRQATQVPVAVTFQTKAEIGLHLIDQANAWRVPHACVVADAGYGDDPVFLNGLETRGEHYVVAVRANFSMVSSRQTTAEVERVDAWLVRLPRWQWQTIRWREGSQGWLRAKFVGVRCWRVDGDGTRHVGWLIGQRPTRGAGEWKYFWSNFPLTTPLEKMVEYTHRRYWVEQFHEEAKSLLGWDQYQGRLWHGFHRHAALIMLTYSFLVWLELRERERVSRRGRPRGAFSPSA
jgi:SRSO17 transposase